MYKKLCENWSISDLKRELLIVDPAFVGMIEDIDLHAECIWEKETNPRFEKSIKKIVQMGYKRSKVSATYILNERLILRGQTSLLYFEDGSAFENRQKTYLDIRFICIFQ